MGIFDIFRGKLVDYGEDDDKGDYESKYSILSPFPAKKNKQESETPLTNQTVERAIEFLKADICPICNNTPVCLICPTCTTELCSPIPGLIDFRDAPPNE